MSNMVNVSPDQMVPPIASALWPEVVPNHGLTIIAGLRPDGGESLHVVCSTNTPPWVLLGMMEMAIADLKDTLATYDDDDEVE